MAALVLGTVTVGMAVWLTVSAFPRGLVLLGLLAVALGTAWYGLRRRGLPRVLGLTVAGLALVTSVLLLVFGGWLLAQLLTLSCAVLTLAAARAAFRTRVPLPPAEAPRRAVLFINPRSGGGKAERFHLADEARKRGIEPIELKPGDDLQTLVRAAVAEGADGLAMAGGDGSQAIVAAIAAEHGLPYACIPAGTRNHFALDLGVDRDDVVGALDAFVDGGEHVVDLGEVNGRVFVNNVSLGLYAEAVQRPGYREAKLKTFLEIMPEVLGPEAAEQDGRLDLRWVGPGGHEHQAGATLLVSNNRYRLGRMIGSGTRPCIDDGLLGIVVLGAPTSADRRPRGRQPWRGWSATTFEVDSDRMVPLGIDGEAVRMEPPVCFRIRPAALRARISKNHPGASPSAMEPESTAEMLRAVLRMALGRGHEPSAVPAA
ncbi:hypothetical protein Psi01_28710 [Planobispora siamensis]|uniref:DAGKc domain-containing protein n=1 Tax=Planobispora siamensis TaxID=936338 RepID=A0A8J3SGP8_9ACTN|nr:hypothetical protein Psi01_28710 [Planobispora siamensis]